MDQPLSPTRHNRGVAWKIIAKDETRRQDVSIFTRPMPKGIGFFPFFRRAAET
jgi:hypothetical protein